MTRPSPNGPSEPWIPLDRPAIRFLRQKERFEGVSIADRCRRILTDQRLQGNRFDWQDAGEIITQAKNAVLERWARLNQAPLSSYEIDALMEFEHSGVEALPPSLVLQPLPDTTESA